MFAFDESYVVVQTSMGRPGIESVHLSRPFTRPQRIILNTWTRYYRLPIQQTEDGSFVIVPMPVAIARIGGSSTFSFSAFLLFYVLTPTVRCLSICWGIVGPAGVWLISRVA
jgi:hypothetical protein